MHEICLSIMMTSINHPLVLVVLILADVLENCFCLYSLNRMVRSLRSNKIVPEDMATETSEENKIIEAKKRKSLTKRTSSVYKLVQDLDEKSQKENAR